MVNETITDKSVDNKKPLPKGWKWVKLGGVCEINPHRNNFERQDNTLITFVPMSAIDEHKGIIARPEAKPYQQIKKGYTFFTEKDVLFAKITPCMENGKHAIASHLIDNIGFGSTEFHVLRPLEQITSNWVHYFIRQPSVLKAAIAHFTGAVGQQRVPAKFLTELEIPLPPLAEQKRIAAILSEKLAAVERARKAAQEQLEAAKALPAAYLREVFESEEAKRWTKKKISEIAKTGSGSTPSRSNNSYYKGNIPWVKTGELKDYVIEDTEEHITEIALKETSLKLLPKGTLLVAMYGQGQTRGRTGILLKPATINQACFAILPNYANFIPEFLQLWFRHNYLRLRRETEGRGGNQPNLNGMVLNNQQILLPNIPKQQQVIDLLKKNIQISDQIISNLNSQLEAINKLPSALLQRAFSGEL